MGQDGLRAKVVRKALEDTMALNRDIMSTRRRKPGWSVVSSQSGAAYYYNTNTGAARWQVPQEVLEYNGHVQGLQAAARENSKSFQNLAAMVLRSAEDLGEMCVPGNAGAEYPYVVR